MHKMSDKPKIKFIKPNPLKNPWDKLKKKPGVTVKSEAVSR